MPNPVVVIEVLSPSTAKLDHGMKVENYFTITSVQHYLIADPDRRVIIHHRRGQDGTVTIEMRRDGMLRLDPPGLDVQVHDMLAEPYAKDAAN